MKKDLQPSWMFDGTGYYAVPSSVQKLPAGVYSIFETQKGIEFYKVNQFKDEIYNLPGLPNTYIIEQVQKFWDSKALYEKHKFVHKRGILLYGPPGNGKTGVIAELVKKFVADDGVVISISRFSLASNALISFRKIEPDRKLMTLIEDMDTLLSGEYKTEEPHALSMLDGQNQVNSILHVATTNYPEGLADRFIKRPGRFDLLVGMGMPEAETRRAYFQKLLGETHEAIEFLTEKTEGLSLAYLKEIASTHLCLGIPIEESVDRLRKSFKKSVKITKAAKMGFKIGYDEESFTEGYPNTDKKKENDVIKYVFGVPSKVEPERPTSTENN